MVFLPGCELANMDLITDEVFIKEVSLGEVRIELSVHEKNGWSVWLTARDKENRRIWRTPFTDEKGAVKLYTSVHEAMQDAHNQLNNIISVSEKRFVE